MAEKFDTQGQPIVQFRDGKLFHYAKDGKTEVPVTVPEGFRAAATDEDPGWTLVEVKKRGVEPVQVPAGEAPVVTVPAEEGK